MNGTSSMVVSVGINAFENLEEFAISVASDDVDGVSVSVDYGTFAGSGFSISRCGEDNSKSSRVRPGEISSLFTFQKTQHILRILKYCLAEDHVTGQLFRHSLEATKLEIGCEGSVLLKSFDERGLLATPT